MKVLGIDNIRRKDIPIYYRQLYTGVAVLELTKGTVNYPIDFSIEVKATGQTVINITFLDDMDYPLVPVVQDLRKIIDSMRVNEELPD